MYFRIIMSDSSIEYSSDGSDSSSDINAYRREYTQGLYNAGVAVALTINYMYNVPKKNPCMTSHQTEDKWVRELLLGHEGRFHNMFRMSKNVFSDLLEELERSHGLEGSSRTNTREVLGITLFILSQNESIRATAERFQHSTETISRYFNCGIRALLRLSIDIIKPEDLQFRDIPAKIKYDDRYMPFFKDCIGAIDGTHVDARIPVDRQIPYIGRHGKTTQNVMAICDFNMCFTFIVLSLGWFVS